jgi:hypothetical protein
LKFHRDAGHHADGEVDPENARPKTRGISKSFIAGAQMFPFEKDNDPRQPHRQLRKQVVIGDGECEL